MKVMTRRQFAATALVAVGAPQMLLPGAAVAQGKFVPTKQVTIIVGYPAGGPTDVYCRAMADGLAAMWKQTVIVENKPGASGSLSALQVLRAPADGHTLLFTNNATNGAYEQLNPKFTGYKTLTDFAPVALFGVVPTVMVVRKDFPANNMAEFIAHAKKNNVSYASSAIGSAPHLASELIASVTGIKMTHIPYKGAAPLMQDLLGSNVDMYIGGPSTVMEYVKSGRIKALAALHPKRLHAAPNVPTLLEQGVKGADYESWFGLLAAAGTPVAVLDSINADARKVMDTPQMKKRLEKMGVEYADSNRQQFWEVVKEEVARAGGIIRDRKITAE